MIPYKNINELLETQAKKFKDKTFLIFNIDDSKVSYKQLNENVNKVANLLLAYGIKKNDKVAILTSNCVEFIYIYFATMKIGAVSNPINFTLKPEELIYILNDSRAKIIFCEDQFKDKIETIKNKLKELKHIILLTKLKTKIKELSPNLELANPPKPEDEALISYTSGSTGNPKGVLLTHKNILTDAFGMVDFLKLTENDRLMCVQPLFYIDDMITIVTPLYCGGSTVLTKKFSKSNYFKWVDKYKVTVGMTVPTMLAFLLNPPEDISQLDISSLRFIIYGGEPTSMEVRNKFEEHYKVLLIEAYGLTECTCVSTFNPPNKEGRKVGSVGKALNINEQKIVDKNGNELPPWEHGEIVIKGNNIMKGYFNNQEETKKTIKNGWLHTGDSGYMDKDGFFYVVGRIKHLIIRGGENISPVQIDEVLHKHPAVKECATIGIPDKFYGEEVKSFVVLKKVSKTTEKELIEHCKKHLAEFKCPKSISFLEEMPKTASDKIDRGKLKEMYKK